jgi:hypothetical protein
VYSKVTEVYDGAAWAAAADTNLGRRNHGVFGTSTAGFVCGGQYTTFTPTDSTEKFNGTNWSADAAMLTDSSFHACAGDESAGLAFGGEDETFSPCTATLEYGEEPPNVGEVTQTLPMLILQTEGIKYLTETLPLLTISATVKAEG